MNIKEKIETLINDGERISKKCFKVSDYTPDYISGSEYIHWLKRCINLMETTFPKHHMKEDLINHANRADGNDISYYHNIDSILHILLESEENELNYEEIAENNLVMKFERIFISHASKDIDYVEKLVQLLNDIGIPKNRKSIFCSSLEGYGIPIGSKIYDYIKQQFTESTLVIFVLSKNYYDSVACLNEMGATWIKSNKHLAILLPSFNFSQIEGAIDPTEVCFKMNDKFKLNSFKNDIINSFSLETIDDSIWESDRDKFLESIEELNRSDRYSNTLTRVDIGRVIEKRNNIEFELRFINNGQIPVKFTEVKIELYDEQDRTVVYSIDDEFLDNKIIYYLENRREVITMPINEQAFDYRRFKRWHSKSYSIAAF